VLLGDGNGTVLEFHADRSAVTDLRVAGVGDSTSGNLSRAGNWEETIRLAYAVADAGVRFVGANDSLVADVGVRTPANGVVFVDSDGGVVRDSRIVGETPSRAGFMSALAFRSRIVVQESQFHGGRDAVYTHRSHGLVVRDNRIRTVRFGVHEMYTSRSLVRNNTVRDADIGLVVMTRPTGNALVDNTVAGGVTGLSTAGSRSYVADNLVFDTKYGVHTATTDTRYTGNLLAGNRYGLRAGSLLPSDRVSGNDFVDNRRHIKARSLGSLQVWTVAERGNYWTGAPGLDRDGDGTLDRSFRPTGPVDGLAYRVDGGPALARAPAVALLRGTRTAVPGFQRAGVLDTAPLAAPAGSDPTARLRRGRERTRQIVENPDRLVVPVPNGTLNASRTGAVERVGRSRPTEVTTP
jgi:nitrous oxidase accessory protein NosD